MLFLRKFPAYSLFMGAFSSCATYYIWALCYFFSFVIFALSTFIGCTTTNLYCLFFIFLLFCPLLPICSNLSLCLCFYFLPLNDPSVFIFFRMLCFRLWVFALRVTGLLLRFYPFFIPIYSLGRHSAKSSFSQIFPHEAVKFKSCSFRDAMPCFLLD